MRSIWLRHIENATDRSSSDIPCDAISSLLKKRSALRALFRALFPSRYKKYDEDAVYRDRDHLASALRIREIAVTAKEFSCLVQPIPC